MKKFTTISIALLMGIAANAEDTTRVLSLGLGNPGEDEPQLMGMGISPNGKYVCGALDMGEGMFVYDLETNKAKYIQTIDEDEGALLIHVDNNGLAIGYDGPGVTFNIEGVRKELRAGSEYKYVLGEDITSDGSIMCGSLVATGFVTYAAYSEDGTNWTMLPQPAEESFGKGTSAKYISRDGKYILGRVGSAGPAAPAIMWVRNNDGKYEIDPLYSKYVIKDKEELEQGTGGKVLIGLFPMGLSDNGIYSCYRGTILDDDNNPVSVACVYNNDTQELKIYNEPQECDEYGMGLTPTAISDDGTFIGNLGAPSTGQYGSFIMEAGETQARTFAQAFPSFIKATGESDKYGFNTPASMTADGRYILGYAFYSDDFMDQYTPAYYITYIIDRGEEYAGLSAVNTDILSTDAIYSIDGNRINKPAKGINIIRMSDGSVRKVMK